MTGALSAADLSLVAGIHRAAIHSPRPAAAAARGRAAARPLNAGPAAIFGGALSRSAGQGGL